MVLPELIKKPLRKTIKVALRLPSAVVFLPVLEKCPYEKELHHDCKGCEKYIGTPFCNY